MDTGYLDDLSFADGSEDRFSGKPFVDRPGGMGDTPVNGAAQRYIDQLSRAASEAEDLGRTDEAKRYRAACDALRGNQV